MLTVGIASSVYISRISIFESYFPGRVTQLELLRPDQGFETVWSGPVDDTLPAVSRIFEPTLCWVPFISNVIRMTVGAGAFDVGWAIPQFGAIMVTGGDNIGSNVLLRSTQQANYTLRYTPDPMWSGTDSIVFSTSDCSSNRLRRDLDLTCRAIAITTLETPSPPSIVGLLELTDANSVLSDFLLSTSMDLSLNPYGSMPISLACNASGHCGVYSALASPSATLINASSFPLTNSWTAGVDQTTHWITPGSSGDLRVQAAECRDYAGSAGSSLPISCVKSYLLFLCNPNGILPRLPACLSPATIASCRQSLGDRSLSLPMNISASAIRGSTISDFTSLVSYAFLNPFDGYGAPVQACTGHNSMLALYLAFIPPPSSYEDKKCGMHSTIVSLQAVQLFGASPIKTIDIDVMCIPGAFLFGYTTMSVLKAVIYISYAYCCGLIVVYAWMGAVLCARAVTQAQPLLLALIGLGLMGALIFCQLAMQENLGVESTLAFCNSMMYQQVSSRYLDDLDIDRYRSLCICARMHRNICACACSSFQLHCSHTYSLLFILL